MGFDFPSRAPVSGRFAKALLHSLLAGRAWLKGWRRDMDGWLVRACRADDPTELDYTVGFTEESAVAVRMLEDARRVDRGDAPSAAAPSHPTTAQMRAVLDRFAVSKDFTLLRSRNWKVLRGSGY